MDTVTAGENILHYRLLEPLGSGGMGIVWKALDTRLGREVALKFVHHGSRQSAAEDTVSLERFAREARLASALNHPNIVTIHDINAVGDRHFIVMEVLRGESLGYILRAGRPSVAEAIGWALQIADALAQAHAAGIVHRDLKPSNVMIVPSQHGQRNVKVLDFGLAKNVGRGALGPDDETQLMDLTLPGRAVGTVGYQSPEQAMGGSVDTRSDVFAFGILFYEMLSGVRPFPGNNWEEFATNLLHRPPEPLGQLCPDLPEGVAAIVDRCLSRDINLRYANCGEVLRDLKWRDPLISSGFSLAPRTGTRTAQRSVLVPFWQRGRVRSAAAAAVLVAVALGTWGYLQTLHRQRGIAVLPFTAVSSDPRTQALSLGLLTALTTDLSSAGPLEKAFWVVPAQDVLQTKAQSTKDARQAFAVDLAIGGSVETEGDQIKVNINIVDTGTLHTLSDHFTASGSTPFALEDQLLGKTMELLRVSLPVDTRNTLRASASPEPGADDYYLQALGYLQGGYDKADAAIEVLGQALMKDPRFARAHAGLAEAYLLKFRFTNDTSWMTKATESAATAARLNPALTEVRIASANISRTEGHYDDAIRTLRAVIDQDPGNRIAWTHLGETNESKRDLAAAEAAFKKAVDLQPGSPLTHQSLGLYYYRLGRYREAEKSFNRERELAPDNYRVYSQLGALYIQQSQYPEAEAMLKRSLALKPSAIAYNNLGTVYDYLGRPRDAVSMMEQAMTLGQKSVVLLANLARTYREVPGLESKAGPADQEAIDMATRQLAINPDNADIRAELAWIYAETGQADAARREMKQALATHTPPASAVRFREVLVNELTGDRAGALAALDALAKTGSYLEEVRRQPELKQLRSDTHYKEKEAAWQTTR